MRYGVVFPQTEFGNDPSAIRDYAQAAEALGFDYLLAYDHVLGAHPQREPKLTGPYTNEHPFHELMMLFAFWAAATRRIQFTTGILILPQRQTALVAKQAAELDVLSGGRFRLGIGLGWNYVEYEALGEDFKNRGKRAEEQVEVLRRLWTEPLVNFHGAFHTINNAGLNPMPIQRPIPIWFGGSAEPALRRAARLGDGWMPAGRKPDDSTKRLVAELQKYLDEFGRDRSSFGMDPWISVANTPKEEWRKRAEEWQRLGATHIALDTMRAGYTTPQAHMEAIRSFRNLVA